MEKRAKKYDPENQPYTDILITCTDPLCSRWHANVAALRVLYLRLCSLHSYVKFFFLGCFFPFRVSYSLNPPPDVYIFVLLCTIVISLVQLVLWAMWYLFAARSRKRRCVSWILLTFHVKTWNKRSQTLERRRKKVEWLAGIDQGNSLNIFITLYLYLFYLHWNPVKRCVNWWMFSCSC